MFSRDNLNNLGTDGWSAGELAGKPGTDGTFSIFRQWKSVNVPAGGPGFCLPTMPTKWVPRSLQGRVRCCRECGALACRSSSRSLRERQVAVLGLSPDVCVRAAHPCKVRKHGAPSVVVISAKPKAGHPPIFVAARKSHLCVERS